MPIDLPELPPFELSLFGTNTMESENERRKRREESYSDIVKDYITHRDAYIRLYKRLSPDLRECCLLPPDSAERKECAEKLLAIIRDLLNKGKDILESLDRLENHPQASLTEKVRAEIKRTRDRLEEDKTWSALWTHMLESCSK